MAGSERLRGEYDWTISVQGRWIAENAWGKRYPIWLQMLVGARASVPREERDSLGRGGLIRTSRCRPPSHGGVLRRESAAETQAGGVFCRSAGPPAPRPALGAPHSNELVAPPCSRMQRRRVR